VPWRLPGGIDSAGIPLTAPVSHLGPVLVKSRSGQYFTHELFMCFDCHRTPRAAAKDDDRGIALPHQSPTAVTSLDDGSSGAPSDKAPPVADDIEPSTSGVCGPTPIHLTAQKPPALVQREKKDALSNQLRFDLDGLTAAIERCDLDYQLAMYADTAEIQVNDPDPDRSPLVYRGKQAIRDWMEYMDRKQLTHRVVDLTRGRGCVSLTDLSRYPDGRNLIHKISADVDGGQIIKQTVTLIWEDIYD